MLVHPPSTGQPRERLRFAGRQNLSESELVAILLGTGTRGCPALETATVLLADVGGLSILADAPPERLERIPGVGPNKAARLTAALELGRRAIAASPELPVVRTSEDIVRLVLPLLANARQERFVGVVLDSLGRAIRIEILAEGGLSSCPVDLRVVFRKLLELSTVAVVFAHNHPSGSPIPSGEDDALTARLVAAGELLGLPVIDHIVIAKANYFSYLDSGRIMKATPRQHDEAARSASHFETE